MPIVSTSLNGTSRTSTPPVMTSATPSAMPSVPSVTISGGTFALAIRNAVEHAPGQCRRPARRRGRPGSRPACCRRPRSSALPAMTPLKTSTAPTDRSMPAVMITNVMPDRDHEQHRASVAMLRSVVDRREAVELRSRRRRSSADEDQARSQRARAGRRAAAARCARSLGSSSSCGSCSGVVVAARHAASSLVDGAGHRADQRPPWSCRRRLEAGDALAEPQHLDAVGDLEHLGHVVADQHDREAAVAHAADQVEHACASGPRRAPRSARP